MLTGLSDQPPEISMMVAVFNRSACLLYSSDAWQCWYDSWWRAHTDLAARGASGTLQVVYTMRIQSTPALLGICEDFHGALLMGNMMDC